MTPTTLPVTVWMNMPTFHQAALLQALNELDGVDLRVHFARALSADRVELGWRADLGDLPADYLHGSVARALRSAHVERRRIHVFGGMWSEPAFAAALVYLRARGSTCAIYMEAQDPHVSRSRLKVATQLRLTRWIAKSAALLPVATLGARSYASSRFDPVYPFGYFQQPVRDAELTRSGARAVFVGQLIDRKGVDVLIEALAPLFDEHSELTLTVIGDGERRGALVAQAGARPIAFVGVLPSAQIQAKLAEMDVLILPSRFDGWGMVVNEALMVGTPVIVSDQCGAADLIRDGYNGWVFPMNDVARLRDRLRAFLSLSATEKRAMRRAAAASRESINAGAAARYLAGCLRHLRGEQPTPPRPALAARARGAFEEARLSDFDPMNPQAKHMADESMVRNLHHQAEAIWPQEQPLFERYALPQGARILDVGCGTGEISIRLAQLLPGASILGIDLIESHLEQARGKAERFQDRVRFQHGNAFALELADGAFDLVVCRHMLQAIPHPERAIAEIVRVTRPGGRVHLLVEDYGMIFIHPTRFDAAKFWFDGPRRYALATGTDLHVGRATYTHLRRLGVEQVAVDYVAVDTTRVPRETFAQIWIAWRDGYAESVAEYTEYSAQESLAHFDDMIATIRDPNGFALWLVPIVSGVVPGT